MGLPLTVLFLVLIHTINKLWGIRYHRGVEDFVRVNSVRELNTYPMAGFPSLLQDVINIMIFLLTRLGAFVVLAIQVPPVAPPVVGAAQPQVVHVVMQQQ